MKFTCYIQTKDPSSFVNEQGIVKALKFDSLEYSTPSNILDYAKTCYGLETLCVVSTYTYLKVTKTTIRIMKFTFQKVYLISYPTIYRMLKS